MNLLEITLILLGLVIIIISSRLIDRKTQGVSLDSTKLTVEEALSDEELAKLKDKLQEQLSEVKEEVIVRTDDELSALSNEKIMAVGEYSDQILEKIKNNHEEVVFLYNMLNEKEKELKSAVLSLTMSQKKSQMEQQAKSQEKEQPTKKTTGIQQLQGQRQIKSTAAQDITPTNTKVKVKPASDAEEGTNNNAEILSLYSQGKSIIEISKQLRMGQGEVKLIIDLYKGR